MKLNLGAYNAQSHKVIVPDLKKCPSSTNYNSHKKKGAMNYLNFIDINQASTMDFSDGNGTEKIESILKTSLNMRKKLSAA